MKYYQLQYSDPSLYSQGHLLQPTQFPEMSLCENDLIQFWHIPNLAFVVKFVDEAKGIIYLKGQRKRPSMVIEAPEHQTSDDLLRIECFDQNNDYIFSWLQKISDFQESRAENIHGIDIECQKIDEATNQHFTETYRTSLVTWFVSRAGRASMVILHAVSAYESQYAESGYASHESSAISLNIPHSVSAPPEAYYAGYHSASDHMYEYEDASHFNPISPAPIEASRFPLPPIYEEVEPRYSSHQQQPHHGWWVGVRSGYRTAKRNGAHLANETRTATMLVATGACVLSSMAKTKIVKMGVAVKQKFSRSRSAPALSSLAPPQSRPESPITIISPPISPRPESQATGRPTSRSTWV